MHIFLAQAYLPGMVRRFIAARHPEASVHEIECLPNLGPDPAAIATLECPEKDCLFFGDGVFSNSARTAIFTRLKALGLALGTAVFDEALVSPDARIGTGSILYPHCVVDAKAVIGFNTIIGPGTIIEDGVTIGNNCFIGAHCVVKRGSEIGSGSYLADGCVVGGVHGYRGESTSVKLGRGVVVYDTLAIRQDLEAGVVRDSLVADDIRVLR
ncbi:acyltransferase [Bordetella holmesii]|nr:acyltransferase [Bordetella holmesii]UEB20049.1 acyltransferase [Bordetella holmesii]SUV91612.1 O-acyltransferase [Bordetella holmesii]